MIEALKPLLPTPKRFLMGFQNAAITVFIGGLWFATALFSYWAFLDNTPPFVSYIYQDEQTVKRGDVAVFRSNVDWLRQCTIRSERHLINKTTGIDINVGEQTTVITRQMVGKTVQSNFIIVFIPNNVPTGDYWFERQTWISCNPVQMLVPYRYTSTRAEITVQ